MRAAGAAVLLVLAACDEAPPVATLDAVPARFVGHWEQSPAECTAGGAWSVTVAPKEVRFPDSVLQVTGVAPDGADAARVDGTFRSAEAEWSGAVRLELGRGGKELSVVNGSQYAPRVKCP